MVIYSSLTFYLCAVVLLISRLQAAEFSITLDGEDKYNLTWSFISTSPSDEITFTVTCATTGWVGLGLSPTGGMAGADIVVMWIDSSGTAHIKDMHAVANGLPTLDDSQDYTLISSSEKNGISTFSFKRKINTCDSDSDNEITTSTTRLIYAYGSKDPTDNVLGAGDKHLGSKRGAKSIYLLDPEQAVAAVPDNALTFDMTIKDYVIPQTDTTYYCSFHEPPTLNSKHHIVAVEPVIQSGNEGFVHHVVIYGCWGLSQEHIRNNNSTEGICETDEMPEFVDSCKSIIFAWAIGGTKFHFPEKAGYSIGSGDLESPEYYMLETHYDNPQGITGRKDSSGIRFTYTSTVRSYDVGNIGIGTVYGIFVPPTTEEFKVIGYCHSSCTRQWLPDEGVTIFGYMLHAHLLGAGIKVEHYREGKSLEIFAEDKAYDFNYQEIRQFHKHKKLMPGDTLKITCTYKSTDREDMTFGGLGTSEEMCLAFLMYYPKQNLAGCASYPGFMSNGNDSLYTGLSLTPNTVSGPGYSYVSAYEALGTVSDWTSAKVSVAQKSYYETFHVSICMKSGGQYYEANEEEFDPASYPEIEEADNDYCDKEEENVASSCIRSTGLIIVMLCAVFMSD